MHKLVADKRGIPTGVAKTFDGFEAELGVLDFDDGFTGLDDGAAFSLTGAGRRLTVELLTGYHYAQVYAPQDQDYVALEPMTASTSALTTGHGLTLIEPRARFRAAFRVRIQALR